MEKGDYRHFMQKEIFEQPQALANTLEGRISNGRVLEACLGPKAAELLARVERVRIERPPPPEAGQLLKVVGIKGLCRQAQVAKIDVGPKGAVVTFRDDHFPNPMGLVAQVQKRAADWRLRPDQKLVVKGEWDTPERRLDAAERILRELAKVALASAA